MIEVCKLLLGSYLKNKNSYNRLETLFFLCSHILLLTCSQSVAASENLARFNHLDTVRGFGIFAKEINSDGQVVWLGTLNGLAMIRPGEIRLLNTSSGHTSSDHVTSILLENEHSIWVGFVGGGVLNYNPASGESFLLQDISALGDANCYDIVFSGEQNLLYLACDTKLYTFDLDKSKLTEIKLSHPQILNDSHILSLKLDKSGDLFLGIEYSGLFKLTSNNEELKFISNKCQWINEIAIAEPHTLLLACDTGAYLLSESLREIKVLIDEREDPFVDEEVINLVPMGSSKYLLLGGSKKVSLVSIDETSYTQEQLHLPYIRQNNIGVLFDMYHFEDHDALVVGAGDSGLFILPLTTSFADSIKHRDLVLSDLSVSSLVEDTVFIADQSHLYKLSKNSRELVEFTTDLGYIYFIHPLSDKLLVSTYEHGLLLLDEADPTSRESLNAKGLSQFEDTNYSAILQLSENQVFIGTDSGPGKGLYYGNFEQGFSKVLADIVTVELLPVSPHKILVVTRDSGVFTYDTRSQTSERFSYNQDNLIVDCAEPLTKDRVFLCLRRRPPMVFNVSDGSYSDYFSSTHTLRNVRDANLDKNGNLWLPSSQGLFIHDSENDRLFKVTESEGVLSNQFAINKMVALNDNRLLIPGNKGLISVDIDKARDFIEKKIVQKTEVFVTQVETSQKHQKTKRFVPDELNPGFELPHSNIQTRIRFSHNNFLEFDSLAFEVRMLGLSEQWRRLEVGQYFADYTSLKPGEYQFEVRVFDPRSGAQQPMTSLDITVLPPWWQTTIAYLMYLSLVVVLLILGARYRDRRLRMVNAQLARQVKERTDTIRRLMQQKQNFFANVSHEFRTPLTLILGPLDSIASRVKEADIVEQIQVLQRNANRLMRLVDQILELAKSEIQSDAPKKLIKPNEAIDLITASFSSLLAQKQQTLKVESGPNVTLSMVEDSFETILSNLLSNAFKYCPNGASILISTVVEGSDLVLSVCDDGPGIATDDIEQLFERFTRFEASENNPGSGIGLALVKQLVLNNGGKIEVHSELGQGSVFRVTLPIRDMAETDNNSDVKLSFTPPISVDPGCDVGANPAENKSLTNELDLDITEELQLDKAHSERILVVEDNQDLRNYICQSLADYFVVDNAIDGEQGLKKAYAAIPDLIVSDILMPNMTGYELLNAIRNDPATSHIPFVLLTAKGDDLSRIKGWQEQADDYITKPFKVLDLHLRIQRLLDIRNILRKKQAELLGNELATKDQQVISFQSKRDKEFFDKFQKVVREHYCEESFSRSHAAKYLALSERQLNRKLAALVDYNFAEYLRKYRLMKSAELLVSGKQVTEVAYDVGFSSPSYFSSCFKAEFSTSPRKYVEQRESDMAS